MKSILIINFLHSSEEQVGARRTRGFVRYLPQFGWSPWVITKPPLNDEGEQALEAIESTFFAPSIPIQKPFHLEVFTWMPFMLMRAVSFLKHHPIQLVLISCPPFHQALAGILLKKWFNVKLVVDYRDAWSLNPYYQGVDRFHRLILGADKVLEKFLLRQTDLLIVSHQTMRENYLRQFSFLKDRVEVIYNGFDPENIGVKEETLFPKFTILHLGNFYARQKTRDPSLFLASLQQFISHEKISPEKLEVLFIGERYEEIEKTISNLGLSSYVSCRERVPHPVAMKYLNKSHLLLLIETMDVMTSKVFEYLATGKPILALTREGEIKHLIETFSKRSHVLTHPDLSQLMNVLEHCYKSDAIHIQAPDESFRGIYNRKNQTRQLAISLDRLMGGDSNRK